MRGQHWVETLIIASVVIFFASYVYASADSFLKLVEQAHAVVGGIHAANTQRFVRDTRFAALDVNFAKGVAEVNVYVVDDNGDVVRAVKSALEVFGWVVR